MPFDGCHGCRLKCCLQADDAVRGNTRCGLPCLPVSLRESGVPVSEANLEVICRCAAELVLEVVDQSIRSLSNMTGVCLTASNGLEANVGHKEEPGTQGEGAFACVQVRHHQTANEHMFKLTSHMRYPLEPPRWCFVEWARSRPTHYQDSHGVHLWVLGTAVLIFRASVFCSPDEEDISAKAESCLNPGASARQTWVDTCTAAQTAVVSSSTAWCSGVTITRGLRTQASGRGCRNGGPAVHSPVWYRCNSGNTLFSCCSPELSSQLASGGAASVKLACPRALPTPALPPLTRPSPGCTGADWFDGGERYETWLLVWCEPAHDADRRGSRAPTTSGGGVAAPRKQDCNPNTGR